jgi:hypothetical protein
VDSGLYHCKVCDSRGNHTTFVRQLWSACKEAGGCEYEGLAIDRKLLWPETLESWGLVKSIFTGEYLAPGYDAKGEICQLYRYMDNGTRTLWYPTPGLHHGLFGMSLHKLEASSIYFCEGIWDGMALWEIVKADKESSVLAIPTASTFYESWAVLCEGRRLAFMPHSDHPRVNRGKTIPPAGFSGMKRAVGIMLGSSTPPADALFLRWGDEGYDPGLKEGYDVRDWLTEADTHDGRVEAAIRLFAKLEPVPDDWVRESKRRELECASCATYEEVMLAFRKAFKVTDGLDRGLACSFAAVISTMAVGSQLWFKMIGPPSSGKTTICEALAVCKDYVLAKSSIRGFHSGWKTDRAGEEDHSLAVQAKGKTLVIKDADTLMTAPNREQILGEARDLYDTTARPEYRNAVRRNYQGIRITLILAGTKRLKDLDASELGERFLDTVIMEDIDDDLEDEVLLRVGNRAAANMALEADGKMETQYDQDMVNFMKLCGGYVKHLRENARKLLAEVQMGDDTLRVCTRYGKFVAYLRARPSKKKDDESADREFAARLVEQMTRLAICLAAVLNRKTVDSEVMRRVRQVALDTGRGETLDIVRHLYEAGMGGMEVRALAIYTNNTEDHDRKLLRFLRRIKAVETYKYELSTGGFSKPTWRLTERMRQLYQAVVLGEAAGNHEGA